MHCRAHLVSVSIWPNNNVTPCCVWGGEPYQDIESMKDDLNQKFSSGNIPSWCQNCTYKDGLTQYVPEKGLQMLDIRSDNICNLKCRSCGPEWSSRWASELGILPIRSQHRYNFKNLDLSNLKAVYYCGGEPFLSDQHLDILNLIPNPSEVRLVYNTNCTTLYYKDQYIPDLWKKFNNVSVNASIDAIGPAAEVVRSGTDWQQTELVLFQLCEIANKNRNVGISLTPVLSALNIWWFDKWLEYFDSWRIDKIWPITVNSGNMISLSTIPVSLRPPIIKMLEESKFFTKFRSAIDILKKDDSSRSWPNFVDNQIKLDLRRNENWHYLLHSSQFWT